MTVSLLPAAPHQISHATSSAPSVSPAGNIRVYVRVRPLNSREREGGASIGPPCLSVLPSRGAIELHARPESRLFSFDHVADAQATQEDVFAKVGKPITDACLAGYNGTILAYGQTGSGKTFTIQGVTDTSSSSSSATSTAAASPAAPSDLRGLMPRVFEYLTSRIAHEESRPRADGSTVSYSCRASFLEIYNERCYDLLEGTSPALALREDSKRGVYVEGLTELPVRSCADLASLMDRGIIARRIGETAMNRESSRSHVVFTLYISSTTRSARGGVVEKQSKFNLIDLAGSERQKATQATGARMDEAKNINRSLSALGNVIRELMKRSTAATAAAAAADGSVNAASSSSSTAVIPSATSSSTSSSLSTSFHVPYRDSKLTFLLRDSLGGNSLTMLVACVSSASSAFFESMSTLKFAAMANQIRNEARVNERESASAVAAAAAAAAASLANQALQAENDKLKQQVQRMLAQQNLGARRLSLMPGLMVGGVGQMPGLVTPSKLLGGGGRRVASVAEEGEEDDQSALPTPSDPSAPPPSSLAEQRLHTMLIASHARESAWAEEIALFQKQVEVLQAKQHGDAMVLRLKEKHIEALRSSSSSGHSTDASDESLLLREANATLHAELATLKSNYAHLGGLVPDLIQQRNEMSILRDRIAQMESEGTVVDNTKGDASAYVPRHRSDFHMHEQFITLVEKHAELTASFDALKSRSPAALLAELSPEERRQFERFELESWKASQGFEAQLRSLSESLAQERDMVAHLEAQLSHALEAAAGDRRNHAEALLLKNGFLMRAEAERAALARTVEQLEAQQAAQSAAALAAQGNQQAETQALSARLLGEVDGWKAKWAQAHQEREKATQELFDANQRLSLLQHQHELLGADLALAQRGAEEARAARVADQAAHKATVEQLEGNVSKLEAQVASLSASLASSSALLDSTRSSLSLSQSEVASLGSRLAASQEELEVAVFRLEGVQEDVDTLNNDYAFQAEQLERSAERVTELEKKLGEKQRAVEAAQTQVLARDEALASVRLELEQAQQAKNYEEEFLALQAQNSDLSERIALLRSELDAAVSEVQKGEDRLVEARIEREQLVVDKHASERSVTELTHALQDYSTRLARVSSCVLEREREVEALKRSVEERDARHDSMVEEAAQSAEMIEQQGAEIARVRAELEQTRAEVALAQTAHTQTQATLKNLQASFDSTQSTLAAVQASEAHSQAQLHSAQAEVATVRALLLAAEERSTVLTSQKDDLERQLADIVAMATRLESGAAAAEQRQEARAAATIEQLRLESSSLRAQLDSLSGDLSRSRSELARARAEFEARQAEFGRMLSEFEGLKRARDEENVSLRAQLEKVEGSVSQARREAQQLTAERTALQAQVASLQHELTSAQSALASLRAEFDVVSRDSDIALQLQTEVAAAQDRVDGLVSERHVWLRELEEARRDEAQSIQSHAALSARLEEAQEALAKAQEERQELKGQVAALSASNAALTGHQNPLQRIHVLQQIKKENEALKAEKAALEREVKKFRKMYTLWASQTSSGSSGGANVAGGAVGSFVSAGSLEKDLTQADEALRAGEQAQTQLRALLAHVAKLDAKVRASTATHQAQAQGSVGAMTDASNASPPLGDITNVTASSAPVSVSVQGKSAATTDSGATVDSFPACLHSLSSLTAQLCSSHAQMEQLRRELSAARKHARIQGMKAQLQRVGTTPTGAGAMEEVEQENP